MTTSAHRLSILLDSISCLRCVKLLRMMYNSLAASMFHICHLTRLQPHIYRLFQRDWLMEVFLSMFSIVVSCLLVPACVLRLKTNQLVAFLQHASLAIVCECGKACVIKLEL